MEGHTDTHGQHAYDVQRVAPGVFSTPETEKALMVTAQIWATLNPHAEAEARLRLVTKLAAALGVCVM